MWCFFSLRARPYNDGLLIATGIFSVLALSISWNNRVALVIGIQVIWCCKPTKKGFLASALLALAAGVGCFYVGLELIPPFHSTSHTTDDPAMDDIFDDDDDDDDYYYKEGNKVYDKGIVHGAIRGRGDCCDSRGIGLYEIMTHPPPFFSF